MSDYKLSVVICAVDETDLLKSGFQKLRAFGKQHEFLFVLARNCSEGCLNTAKEICRDYPECHFVIQSGTGLGNAMQDAFRTVTGSHFLIWCADDAIDVSVFPQLVNLSRQSPDVIIKLSRWLPGSSLDHYGAINKVINYISQKMFALLFSSDLTDYTNPTQITPISVYRSIHWERQDAAILPEMVIKPLLMGCRFVEIPCKVILTSKKNSHIHFSEKIRYYSFIFKLRFKKSDTKES